MEIPKIYRNSIISSIQNIYIFLSTLGIYFVYIPWNLERLKLVETDLGLWLFLFGVFNLISNQITGRIIAPKIGSKNIIIIGTIIIAMCPLLLVSVNSYSMFMFIALPFGIAVGFIFPTNQSLISYIESKTNKIYTPLFQAFMAAGTLSGALIAAYVIKKDIDPQITFAVMGVIILISAVAVYFLGLPKVKESKETVDRFKMPEKQILIFGILLMMNFATVGIIVDWSSLWLTKDLMSPLFLGGLAIVFFNSGEIIARLLASFLISRLGEKFVGGYLPIVGALILFVSILTANLYIIVPALVLFGLFTANFMSIVIRQAIKVTKEPISLAVSNLTTLGFSGFIFGPAIVGYTAKNIGLTFNMYVICVVWALSAIFLIKMIRAEEYCSSAI